MWQLVCKRKMCHGVRVVLSLLIRVTRKVLLNFNIIKLQLELLYGITGAIKGSVGTILGQS